MAQEQSQEQSKQTAIAKKGEEPKNVTTLVRQQVERLMQNGGIVLPSDYSVENALKNAWFYIQNSDNRDKILACTPESQATALFDMCVQGMDIGKKQGYLIPYGSRLTFQRSYFGDESLACRVRPGIILFYDVIYKGEEFATAKVRNKYGLVTTVGKHEQKWPRESRDIEGAYCGIVDADMQDVSTTVMDMDQIKTSWKKSKTYGPNSNTFHNDQPDQACLRTVIRRATKAIINTSTDKALLDSVNRQDQEGVLAEVDAEIAEKGNKDVIDIAPQLAVAPESQQGDEERGEGQQTLEVEEQGQGGAQPSF